MNRDREGAWRSNDLYNVSNFTRKSTEHWKTALFSLFILAPPPSPPLVVPSLGTAVLGDPEQSRHPGAGLPDHPQDWGLLEPLPPSSGVLCRTSVLQGQEKRLAGNWWETGWHLPPTTPWGAMAALPQTKLVKIRCRSKCQWVSKAGPTRSAPWSAPCIHRGRGGGGGGAHGVTVGWPWWQCGVGALRQAWNAFT